MPDGLECLVGFVGATRSRQSAVRVMDIGRLALSDAFRWLCKNIGCLQQEHLRDHKASEADHDNAGDLVSAGDDSPGFIECDVARDI